MNLIFFVATGEKYVALAKHAIATLRLTYKEDIILLSDQNVNINNVITKKINHKKNGKHLKALSFQHIDFAAYDKIFYFDVDIVFCQNINLIFNHIDETNIVCVKAQSPKKIFFSNCCRFACDNKKEEEISKKICGSNSGVFGGSSKNVLAFCEQWLKNLEKPNALRNQNFKDIYDQPSYNATIVNLLLSKSIKQTFLPSHLYSYNGKNLEKVLFSHLTHKKDLLEKISRKIIQKNKNRISLL